MAAPSQEELTVLKVFRDAIKTADLKLTEHEGTDMALLAWLRARDMSIPKSVDMLKKNIAWKKEEDIDNILSWKGPESYHIEFPYEIVGRCKDGSPVLFLKFGKWELMKCVEGGGRQSWLRWVDKFLYECIEDMRQTNESRGLGETPVTQIMIIADLEGYGFRQLASIKSIQALLELVTRFESNYPERLKLAYGINTSKAFTVLLSIVKSVLTTRTLSKIELYGSNADKWKPILLKEISPDQLPEFLGGTNLNHNIELENKSSMEDQLITKEIPAGQRIILDFEIKIEKSVLEWIFNSDSFDIGFSILYNSKAEALPYKKYDSHVSSHFGTLECEKVGTYTVTFDNSYSKFRAKTIHYLISVREPQNIKDL